LSQFNREFGKRYVNHQTVVIILSDGWDTGNPEVLSNAMETLHKQAHKILWLNPLAGNPNFQANTVGCRQQCHLSVTLLLCITSKVSSNWEDDLMIGRF
jgi:uncharacterized protein with von Willebrand factor type A (vWA) domain